MADRLPRILGSGYAVPEKIRTNDDPIFDWLKAWLKSHPQASNPFTGYDTRHVLSGGETLVDLLLPSARGAMASAKVGPDEIELLVGVASVSEYWSPTELALLHQKLGLPERVWVVPLANEFSNFSAALLFADALIRAGRIRYALVVAGGNWTRHVDYHTVQSTSAADGAAAAVLGASDDATAWTVVDTETITQSNYYGSMFMRGLPRQCGGERVWTDPVFQITPEGFAGFASFGTGVAPQAVTNLLARRGLSGDDIALIAHQASSVLFDKWCEVIHPAQLIQTIAQFANMTVANTAVNFAWASAANSFGRDKLVLLSLGPEMHANALLLERNA